MWRTECGLLPLKNGVTQVLCLATMVLTCGNVRVLQPSLKSRQA